MQRCKHPQLCIVVLSLLAIVKVASLKSAEVPTILYLEKPSQVCPDQVCYQHNFLMKKFALCCDAAATCCTHTRIFPICCNYLAFHTGLPPNRFVDGQVHFRCIKATLQENNHSGNACEIFALTQICISVATAFMHDKTNRVCINHILSCTKIVR